MLAGDLQMISATQPKRPRLRTRQAATYTGLAKSTLEKLRVHGGGCPYMRVGRVVVYDPALASFSLKHIDSSRRTVFHDAREVRSKNAKTFISNFFPLILILSLISSLKLGIFWFLLEI